MGRAFLLLKRLLIHARGVSIMFFLYTWTAHYLHVTPAVSAVCHINIYTHLRVYIVIPHILICVYYFLQFNYLFLLTYIYSESFVVYPAIRSSPGMSKQQPAGQLWPTNWFQVAHSLFLKTCSLWPATYGIQSNKLHFNLFPMRWQWDETETWENYQPYFRPQPQRFTALLLL